MAVSKEERTKTSPMVMMMAGVFLVVLANMATEGLVLTYIKEYMPMLLSGDLNFNGALSSLGL